MLGIKKLKEEPPSVAQAPVEKRARKLSEHDLYEWSYQALNALGHTLERLEKGSSEEDIEDARLSYNILGGILSEVERRYDNR